MGAKQVSCIGTWSAVRGAARSRYAAGRCRSGRRVCWVKAIERAERGIWRAQGDAGQRVTGSDKASAPSRAEGERQGIVNGAVGDE